MKRPRSSLSDRGPKATFLGTAIEAPKNNIDVFVDEAHVA